MRYVLDSSVAFKWEVVEAHTDVALRLRDETRQGQHELLAPDVFPVEIAHAITRAERQRRLTLTQGAAALAAVLVELPHLFPSLGLLSRASVIASLARIGIYDCLYVALAEREGCSFITADAKLVSNLQASYPFIVEHSTLPGP